MEAIKQIPLNTLTKTELETVTNYVLYGKDIDGTSPVDRKEIQIKTKFNSYNKNRTVSLDEMMESPTFDNSILLKDHSIYKKVKPSIDREKAKNIPGMKELWEQIDKLQDLLDQNTGKKEKLETTKTLTQKEIYLLTHQLIEIRNQQYYLMDSEFPTIFSQQNKAEYFTNPVDQQLNYLVLPRGVMRVKNDQDFINPRNDKNNRAAAHTIQEIEDLKNSGKPFFDFRNPDHIYQLIQYYQEIVAQIEKYPDSLLHNLLWTLDFYIEKAGLSEQQLLIIRDKKFKVPNKEIAQHLMDELGIYHQENYISTIWNKCVKLITDAVELNYDEWLSKDYDKAWKCCNRCGRELLRDSRNFVKKSRALDGLSNCCKQCDKERRLERKKNG